MAIEVIKLGESAKRLYEKYEIECDGCQSILSVCEDDAIFFSHDWIRGRYMVCECPICNQFIIKSGLPEMNNFDRNIDYVLDQERYDLYKELC